MKDRLLGETETLSEASDALEKIAAMRPTIAEAASTLGKIQHLVVDVLLIRPAADQAVQALKPVVEFTKMSGKLRRSRRVVENEERETESASEPIRKGLDVAAALLDWF